MTNASKSKNSPAQRSASHQGVHLPGFINDEEIGLGDVLKRATSYFFWDKILQRL